MMIILIIVIIMVILMIIIIIVTIRIILVVIMMIKTMVILLLLLIIIIIAIQTDKIRVLLIPLYIITAINITSICPSMTDVDIHNCYIVVFSPSCMEDIHPAAYNTASCCYVYGIIVIIITTYMMLSIPMPPIQVLAMLRQYLFQAA